MDLLIEKGAGVQDYLPDSIRASNESIAETIENNVRRLITEENPTNPIYYQRMSELLDELILRRKQEDLEYQNYLKEIVELSKKIKYPSNSQTYPKEINTRGKQALYDNLGSDEVKAETVHNAIMQARSDDWRMYPLRERAVKRAVYESLSGISPQELNDLFEIIKNQNEY